MESCPHCGLSLTGDAVGGDSALRSLGREIEKLHDIARERATRGALEDQQRIDELAREVRHLRETVARLRGAPSALPLARS